MTTDNNQQQQRRPTTMTNNNTAWVIKKTIQWKLVFAIEIKNLETMNNNDWQWQRPTTTTKMNKEEKWWQPTTTNNNEDDNQQWRPTWTKMSNKICLSLKELQANPLIPLCPAIFKVPTPNHDVHHSLVTAQDYITPDWCPHTLQASFTHVWEQFPRFLHPICIHF